MPRLPSSEGTATYQVRALERGLAILTTFTSERPDWGLQELHEALGVNKATLLRLLSVLRATGFVQLDETTGKYRLGIRALEVGSAFVASRPVEQVALPYLRDLSARTGQTANMAVLDGQEVVHTAVVEPDRPLRFHTRVGLRDAAYCTGLGKVLLAHLPPEQLEAYLAHVRLQRRTPTTITTKTTLRRELALVGANGYAEDREEDIIGLRCLAVPVFDAAGDVLVAVSITGPAAEFTGTARGALEGALRQTANDISERLGYSASTWAINAGQAATGS